MLYVVDHECCPRYNNCNIICDEMLWSVVVFNFCSLFFAHSQLIRFGSVAQTESKNLTALFQFLLELKFLTSFLSQHFVCHMKLLGNCVRSNISIRNNFFSFFFYMF